MKYKKRKNSVNKYKNNLLLPWLLAVVVLLAALYLVFLYFLVQKRWGDNDPVTVDGFLDKKTCEEASGKVCYEISTIQEDKYFIPAQ